MTDPESHGPSNVDPLLVLLLLTTEFKSFHERLRLSPTESVYEVLPNSVERVLQRQENKCWSSFAIPGSAIDVELKNIDYHSHT